LTDVLARHPEHQRQGEAADDGRPPGAVAHQDPDAGQGLENHEIDDERDTVMRHQGGQVVVERGEPSRGP
jgi:hypothetical protein